MWNFFQNILLFISFILSLVAQTAHAHETQINDSNINQILKDLPRLEVDPEFGRSKFRTLLESLSGYFLRNEDDEKRLKINHQLFSRIMGDKGPTNADLVAVAEIISELEKKKQKTLPPKARNWTVADAFETFAQNLKHVYHTMATNPQWGYQTHVADSYEEVGDFYRKRENFFDAIYCYEQAKAIHRANGTRVSYEQISNLNEKIETVQMGIDAKLRERQRCNAELSFPDPSIYDET